MCGKNKITPVAGLATDIHCHALHDVDDGVRDLDESLALLEAMREGGIRKVFLSPHTSGSVADSEVAEQRLVQLREAVRKAGLDVRLELHGEYFLDSSLRRAVASGRALRSLPGGYLLVEVSMRQRDMGLQQALFELQDAGYKPVLAHPERYTYYGDGELKGLRDAGCLFQVNLLSLAGHYGAQIRKRAAALAGEGMCDLLGSDFHRPSHARVFADRALHKVLEGVQVRNHLFD